MTLKTATQSMFLEDAIITKTMYVFYNISVFVANKYLCVWTGLEIWTDITVHVQYAKSESY